MKNNISSLNIPLSLYVHIPWCIKKCPYCDFNSYAIKNKFPEELYIEKLLLDLEQDLQQVKTKKIISIYFGGGTPSLFSPQAFAKFIDMAARKLQFVDNIEITMEANPGTLEYKSFINYREAGINRVSLGVQSFATDKLQALGRVHSRDNIFQAVENLKASGLDNFNLDLMYGLPGQSIDQALEDLATAISLDPTHISWYNLTIEPNTYFYKHPPLLPTDDKIYDIMLAGKRLLAQHKYLPYEVSAYAKESQFKSRHNINYWNFGDYLGIGAGAHGKITTDQVNRTWKTRNPNDYLAKHDNFRTGEKQVIKPDIIFEFMLNALRLDAGFNIEQFYNTTGLTLEDIKPKLDLALDKNLIRFSNNIISPTVLGARYLNNLCEIFLP